MVNYFRIAPLKILSIIERNGFGREIFYKKKNGVNSLNCNRNEKGESIICIMLYETTQKGSLTMRGCIFRLLIIF